MVERILPHRFETCAPEIPERTASGGRTPVHNNTVTVDEQLRKKVPLVYVEDTPASLVQLSIRKMGLYCPLVAAMMLVPEPTW